VKLFILFLFSISTFAKTTVYITLPDKGNFSRTDYPNSVLTLALEKTKKSHGPFEIVKTVHFRRDRALKELIKGELINVHKAPTRNEWESSVIPIYIPIRKGILGYRLLLIKSENKSLFKNITSFEELNSLKCGTGEQWSITRAMDALGFQLVKGKKYEGLFGMLDQKRFDYFPRGINEIFGEFSKFKPKFQSLEIEKTLAVYIPQPTYFFVSPKFPKLAKRIEEGLRIAIKDGSFEKLFLKYQSKKIKRANLSNRKIIKLKNPVLNKHEVFDNKSLWYSP
jgi:hypothetical protein